MSAIAPAKDTISVDADMLWPSEMHATKSGVQGDDASRARSRSNPLRKVSREARLDLLCFDSSSFVLLPVLYPPFYPVTILHLLAPCFFLLYTTLAFVDDS